MTKKKDWVTKGIMAFFVFSNIFSDNASANQLKWKLITDNVTVLLALQKTYTPV